MIKDEIIKALRDMARYPTVTLPRDSEALKSAADLLAQPAQQEPVPPKCGAIIEVFGKDWRLDYMSLPVGKHKLYTQQYNYTHPAREPLTDEEITEIYTKWESAKGTSWADLIRAIEAAHGIKE